MLYVIICQLQLMPWKEEKVPNEVNIRINHVLNPTLDSANKGGLNTINRYPKIVQDRFSTQY